MKQGDSSKFVKKAVRWRIFQQAMGETRRAFEDVPAEDLQRMINETVEDVREKRYQARSQRA